jgi:LmbE family N-acetylglucosaminyl deacetylase
MQAQSALAQMRALPIKAFDESFAAAPMLILAPHPDDESLGCGGLIAEACSRGNPPFVVILTDGSRSHPNSRAYPADRLSSLREAETKEAVGRLGLPRERLVFLRYPDTEAPREGVALTAAIDCVAGLIAGWSCSTVVVSWRHDPHCDHEAAAAIAESACRRTGAKLLAYPVWGLTLASDTLIDEPPIMGFRLDIARYLPAKHAAIRAHRSQYAGIIADDPGGFQMPPEFIDMFLQPLETYIHVDLVA